MMSIEALESVIRDYEGTVLFVSHDRQFVNTVADRLFVFENQSITEFDGNLNNYLSSRQRPKMLINNETERIALQMRIAEVVGRLSKPDADREALEAEYQRLILQLM